VGKPEKRGELTFDGNNEFGFRLFLPPMGKMDGIYLIRPTIAVNAHLSLKSASTLKIDACIR